MEQDYPFFDRESCDLCGECLVCCRYLNITFPEAREEMRRLAEGLPTRMVHRHCISCYACDAFCP